VTFRRLQHVLDTLAILRAGLEVADIRKLERRISIVGDVASGPILSAGRATLGTEIQWALDPADPMEMEALIGDGARCCFSQPAPSTLRTHDI
jgi:hypothetical protein